MHNITLVGTRHDEIGKCNSNELYRIIETINPELIFEEMPPSLFNEYYINKTRNNLETNTISRYSLTHKVEHIPVDSDNIPAESFFQNHRYMLQRIEGLVDVNGFNYRNLTDRNRMYVAMYGFQYLNSDDCINLNNEISDAIKGGLQKLNNDRLFQTYELWKNINENRENEMLQNIYGYSKEYSYNSAIFTVGAAHRKSIIQKIQDYETNEKLALNWTFYDDQGFSYLKRNEMS